MPKSSDILDRIADTARETGRRSKLLLWMRAHHAEFAALIEENRPNWAALAEAFAKEGFTAPDGKPLRPESVRDVWYRCRKEVEKKPVRTAPQVTAVASKTNEAADGGMDAKDALTELRRQMNQRSGRR